MDLKEIRAEIDIIDEKIEKLFAERMRLCGEVADYKAKNLVPVFSHEREEEILERISETSADDVRNASRALFTQIMDISKCVQRERIPPQKSPEDHPFKENPTAACPGIRGSYSEEACKRIFGENAALRYYDTFAETFSAIDKGEADYGVLPIENSTAGIVEDTYSMLERREMYISRRLSLPIKHVFAAKKGASLGEIKSVLSHEQALNQCRAFIEKNALSIKRAPNTSIAARDVARGNDPSLACICSAYCAKLYELDILAENIADCDENFTRFIVVSKTLQIPNGADTISVCVSLPHKTGSLWRLLTRFFYLDLNLTKIESRPMPPWIKKKVGESSFDFIFYLDFEGKISDPAVASLLDSLEQDCAYYRFLGNYTAAGEKEDQCSE